MENRLLKLRTLLKKNNVDAILISSLSNIIHLSNFSHFTNIEREGFLLITPNKQYIITDARYSHAVKTELKDFQLLEISGKINLSIHLENVIKEENISTLGIDEDNLTVREYNKINKIISQNHHVAMQSLRIIKDETEIKLIKKACAIGDKAFAYIVKQLKTGMTEKNLASLLEIFIKSQNADLSFPSIVAFGQNAAIPHHKSNNKKLTKNNFVLLDFGVKYENYCSDMTRTIFFGKATKEEKKVYETVLSAQQKAIQQFNNVTMKQSKKIKAADIDKSAREYIISQGYPSIPHSLGHGIGLQVHEAPSLSPSSKNNLENGMVFSIEPGIYLPDNLGVRIEDLFTIQDNKLRQLTKSPRELIEIPSFEARI